MNFIYKLSFVVLLSAFACVIHASPYGTRYGKPRSVDDMLDGMNGYEENPVYELRKRAGGPDTEHFARMNRRQELTNLYGKIVKEFPFLANQGLLRPNDRKMSIDDLLAMSVFGQPKMGKK